jgi:hypothetical protein
MVNDTLLVANLENQLNEQLRDPDISAEEFGDSLQAADAALGAAGIDSSILYVAPEASTSAHPGCTYSCLQSASPGSGIGSFLGGLGRLALGVVGKIFASPNTVIGLVIGVAGVPFGADIGFENDAIVFKNYPWGANLGRALTLGNVQIYTAGNLPTDTDFLYGSSTRLSLGLHERGHTVQSYVFGPFFLPFYLLSGGLPNSNHPFELAANEYARGGRAIP